MEGKRKAYAQLHLAVFLYGFTAILGDWIDLSSPVLVWWRVCIATISLFFLIQFSKQLPKLPHQLKFIFIAIGGIVCLHWVCFFAAIKLSNASITLVCLATTSFFTSFLEPFILKQNFKWIDILIGALIVPAMYLVVQGIPVDMVAGIWVGLLSAFFAALFATLNKKFINKAEPISITFWEMGGAWLLLTLVVPILFFGSEAGIRLMPQGVDWIYLLILALICTTFAYVINLNALKYISAFAANLVMNLEPVYGIILAIFILKEHKELGLMFYIGVAIIILAVIFYPRLQKKYSKADE